MLHHDPEGGLGGATHMAWRTADALAARGHDVALAGTPPARGRHPAPAAPPTLGAERRARWLGPDLPASVGQVAGTTGWVPEVVHVTDLVDPQAAVRGLALADGAGALLAVTPATDAVLWSDRAAGGALARQADVVFALTPSERRALEGAGVDPGRLAALGQGPQLAGIPDPARFRARVGARADGPLVLFLGRKLPTKGYQHLIAAAPTIRERHPEATIVVAGPEPSSSSGSGSGGGPCRPGVGGEIVACGALDETEKYSALVAADVLVLPTVADAFPLVFVEAWTCGVPVVSGPFPGAHEVVRDGVDGLIVAADPVAVAHAVNQLLDDPVRRRTMGRAGRHRAATELSWDAVAADAERGYREAARTRALPGADAAAVPAGTTPSEM
jgi:glycosyltransferase involved in cell wall biosynthesis